MAFKSQLQTNTISNLCKANQYQQHHEVLSCNVTKRLFGRFEILLKTILPENIDDKERTRNRSERRKVPKRT